MTLGHQVSPVSLVTRVTQEQQDKQEILVCKEPLVQQATRDLLEVPDQREVQDYLDCKVL